MDCSWIWSMPTLFFFDISPRGSHQGQSTRYSDLGSWCCLWPPLSKSPRIHIHLKWRNIEETVIGRYSSNSLLRHLCEVISLQTHLLLTLCLWHWWLIAGKGLNKLHVGNFTKMIIIQSKHIKPHSKCLCNALLQGLHSGQGLCYSLCYPKC